MFSGSSLGQVSAQLSGNCPIHVPTHGLLENAVSKWLVHDWGIVGVTGFYSIRVCLGAAVALEVGRCLGGGLTGVA